MKDIADNFDRVDTVEGVDDKKHPASDKVAELKRKALRDEIANHPEKSDRQLAKETGVSPTTVGNQRKKKDKNIKTSIIPVNNKLGVSGYHIVSTEIADGEESLTTEGDVFNMDCLEFMKDIPDSSIDLIIADPPYYRVCGDFDFVWETEKEYLDWLYECLEEFKRILKPNGTLMLWGELKKGKITICRVAVHVEDAGMFILQNWITQRNFRGCGTKRNYMSCREELLFYTKNENYTFNIPYLDEPTNRKDKGANGKERKSMFKRVSNVWVDIAEASQSSIERCFHPTVKALGLCNRIVKTHSNEGDLVYVPFVGSGNEIISCIKNNRNCIGTEIDEEYFTKGIERIEDRISKK